MNVRQGACECPGFIPTASAFLWGMDWNLSSPCPPNLICGVMKMSIRINLDLEPEYEAPLFLRRMGQAPRNKPKRLGEKLLQIREALGLSQKEMAKRLSERTGFRITQTHVSNYERDRVEPFLETTLAYARLANVEMNDIADDDVDLKLSRKNMNGRRIGRRGNELGYEN